MTRQTKTPAQRAKDQLDVAKRQADRLTKKVTAARGELEQLEAEWKAAVARRDHLAQHPDLPSQSNSSSTNPPEENHPA